MYKLDFGTNHFEKSDQIVFNKAAFEQKDDQLTH